DALVERIAIFTAVNVTAILRKTGRGKNPNAPVCVTADGTTFYKSKLLRGKLDHHIREFTNGRNGLYCDFVKADNGVLCGTAIAALQNTQ
ncbi:MAG: hexokinase, partial [Clostridiales bacterium]|nr:hexokinase [Clostridiales bacterium]